MSKQMLELADKADRVVNMMRKLLPQLPFIDQDVEDLKDAVAVLRQCSADSDALRDQAFKTVEVLETSEIKFDMAYRLFVAKQLRKAMRNEPQSAPPRDAVIEECAKVLDDAAQDWNRIRDPGMANNARSYAKKIRLLKSQQSQAVSAPILKAADELHDLGFEAGWNAAVEESAKVSDGFTCGVCGMDGSAGKAIRSLTRPQRGEDGK